MRNSIMTIQYLFFVCAFQGVRDISEVAFDIILEENYDSELEGEDDGRRVACFVNSSYARKIQVYTGKLANGHPEKTQGMGVVLDLTEGLRGHKREVFSSKFAFTPTTTLVSYLHKKNKNVVLLSKLHRDGSISDRDDRKPIIIMDYNRNKRSVDNLDMVIGAHSCRRMTAQWPLAIFHNIIDGFSYNAFVIWREINPTWMSHKSHKSRVFLEQLGKALVAPLIERMKKRPPNRDLRSDCENFSECWTSGST
ncbi:unnamed protein product [Lepeophtheirus salmonis]|uniref:(salmon louse) hypothetical protein n=1 Tax=Lepeophtheirus salmonis TaxID=72036 RepID=A0A7R8CJ25_LEPSM|nr:unnamed protein product [Lepeophtheirus salmonis]CAF2834164.1 unnamed protein product [Lepeophtheirus salmonis]